MRQDGGRASAEGIVRCLVERGGEVALRVQEEMAEGVPLHETGAGSVLEAGLRREIKGYEEEVERSREVLRRVEGGGGGGVQGGAGAEGEGEGGGDEGVEGGVEGVEGGVGGDEGEAGEDGEGVQGFYDGEGVVEGEVCCDVDWSCILGLWFGSFVGVLGAGGNT